MASGIQGVRSDSIDFHEPLDEFPRDERRVKAAVTEPPPSYSSAETSPPTYEQAVETQMVRPPQQFGS